MAGTKGDTRGLDYVPSGFGGLRLWGVGPWMSEFRVYGGF